MCPFMFIWKYLNNKKTIAHKVMPVNEQWAIDMDIITRTKL